MPSVTDLAKSVGGPQDGLIEWANRVGLEGKTMAQARSAPQSDGNRLHDELQRLVLGEPLLDAADDAVIALAEWWSDASAGMVSASAETPLRAVVETPLGTSRCGAAPTSSCTARRRQRCGTRRSAASRSSGWTTCSR